MDEIEAIGASKLRHVTAEEKEKKPTKSVRFIIIIIIIGNVR